MLIPPELASLLGNQCTIIVDNAKSPAFSATESAESLPALSPYRRSNKAKRATRQQLPRSSKSNKKKTSAFLQTALVAPACRWTADLCHGSPLQHYQQQRHHELTNEAPRKSSSQFVNDRLTTTLILSPQQRRSSLSRRPSLTSSPKMPSRQASFRNSKTPTSPSSLRSLTPSSSGGTDSCPRQPQRRSCIQTAEILQEALNSIRICDLDSDNNDDKNNDDALSPTADNGTSARSATVSSSPPPSHINVVAPSSRQ